jgi:hypothetical protein
VTRTVPEYAQYVSEVELRHGYSLGDINRLAHMAVIRHRWDSGIGFDDRVELAWCAIAEHLWAVQDHPAVSVLIRAAMMAIRQEAQGDQQAHGISTRNRHGHTTAFFRFWIEPSRHTTALDERVTERIALWQIWDALRPAEQRAFLALAAHGDHTLAAAAAGLTVESYHVQLYRTRRAFLRLWHEGEEPSHVWAATKRRTSSRRRQTVTAGIVGRRKRKQRQIASHSASGGHA